MATQTPANTGSRMRTLIGTAGVLLAHAFALAILLMVLQKVVPQYMRIFEAHKIALPDISKWVLLLSDRAVHWGYLLVPALVPDAIVYLLLARLGPQFNWLASVWAYLILLGTILLLGVLAVAMYVPLQQVLPAR